jgi:hypothetical protein
MGLKPIVYLDVRTQTTPASQWAAIGNAVDLLLTASLNKQYTSTETFVKFIVDLKRLYSRCQWVVWTDQSERYHKIAIMA